MTPSQTQALQEVKDEVAKKHGYRNLLAGIFERNKPTSRYTVTELVDEVSELYHTRLLVEAGNTLWTDDKLNEIITRASTMKGEPERKGFLIGAFFSFKKQASALLAAKQVEVDNCNGKLKYWRESYDSIGKENISLKSQLQESKAEVERLKYMIDKGFTWEDTKNLSIPKKSEQGDKTEVLPCKCERTETFIGWGNEKCVRCVDCGKVW